MLGGSSWLSPRRAAGWLSATSELMDTLLQDIRYGLRMLRESPGFTVVALVTIALGIAANTLIFSVVHSMLLRPLPFPDSGRILSVWTQLPRWGREEVSVPDFQDWRAQATSFEAMAAVTGGSATLGGTSDPQRIAVRRASSDLWRVLQAPPVMGRTFAKEEDTPNGLKVVMLSHAFWQSRFGGKSEVIGQSIQLNAVPYTVIGVAPAESAIITGDVWIPLAVAVNPAERRSDFLTVIGRLKPGVSREQAQAELDGIAKRLEQAYPATNKGVGIGSAPLHEDLVRDLRPLLLSLWAAVGFVLLMVVANVSGLLLARGAARQKELAIRVTLGAGRHRLVRQLLTESVLLGVLGGALGLGLTFLGLSAVLKFVPRTLPYMPPIEVSMPVLLFALGLAVATGLLFGVLPSLSVAGTNLNGALKEGGRTSAAGARPGWRRALVVSEIAVSLLLLAGAGLMIRTLYRLQQVDPGFRTDNVLTLRIALPHALYKEPRAAAFYQELVSRIQRLPQAKSAAAVSDMYMTGGSDYLGFVVQGLHEQSTPGNSIDAELRVVTPEFLSTLAIPLVRGRGFTDMDNGQSTPVALINERLARRYFSSQDLLGKRISFGDSNGAPKWIEIVGVVADVHQDNLATASYPEIFLPLAQSPQNAMTIVVHSDGKASGLLDAVRQEVKTLDASVPIYGVHTVEELMSATTVERRVQMYVLGGFAGLGLLLAMIGIYGVMAQVVAQRTSEFGIRMALGARPLQILQMVLRHGVQLTLIGLSIGLAGTLLLTRFLAGFLYGVTPHDPWTLAGVLVLLSGSGLLACYVPARRAMRLDPMVALRYE